MAAATAPPTTAPPVSSAHLPPRPTRSPRPPLPPPRSTAWRLSGSKSGARRGIGISGSSKSNISGKGGNSGIANVG